MQQLILRQRGAELFYKLGKPVAVMGCDVLNIEVYAVKVPVFDGRGDLLRKCHAVGDNSASNVTYPMVVDVGQHFNTLRMNAFNERGVCLRLHLERTVGHGFQKVRANIIEVAAGSGDAIVVRSRCTGKHIHLAGGVGVVSCAYTA
jgi:hypothetical protein